MDLFELYIFFKYLARLQYNRFIYLMYTNVLYKMIHLNISICRYKN